MISINNLKVLVLPLVVAIGMYFYNSYIGRHGVYLFDFSIVYNMGWLIFNGWQPFIDFRMPLMPLSGTLVALSFYMFGVSYYSAVKLAGIISALSFIYIAQRLKKYLGYIYGHVAAFLIILSTVPVQGTFYYNHLSALLSSIFLVLVINYIYEYKSFLGKKETLLSAEIYLFISLILFNKIHIGLLAGALFFFLEAFLSFKEKNKFKDELLRLAISISPLILMTLMLLIWINFSIADLSDNLFNSASPSNYISKGSLMTRMGIGGHNDIFSSVGINIYLISLFSIGLIFYHLKFCRKNSKANKLLYLIVTSLVVQILSFISSEEASTIDLPFVMIYFVMMYLYFAETIEIKSKTELKKIRFICALFTSVIFIFCANYIVFYSMASLRKSYDENKMVFYKKNEMPKNKYISEAKFFDKIKINYIQKKNFDYLDKILKEYRGKNIFLGSEIEIFYPVAEIFPPSKWPIWLHRDISYNSANHSEMKKIFINQNYDVVIFSKNRNLSDFDFTTYLNDYMSSNYLELKHSDPEIWIKVFLKK